MKLRTELGALDKFGAGDDPVADAGEDRLLRRSGTRQNQQGQQNDLAHLQLDLLFPGFLAQQQHLAHQPLAPSLEDDQVDTAAYRRRGIVAAIPKGLAAA